MQMYLLNYWVNGKDFFNFQDNYLGLGTLAFIQ